MGFDPASRARFSLDKASILLLDNSSIGMSILVQIVAGLGAKQIHRCEDVEQAQEAAVTQRIDLAIIDAMAPTGAGYDFVRWLRTGTQEPNCFTPVLMTTAHTPAKDVIRARDCGSHIMIKKPIAPIVMLERIVWVAKGGRPFLFTDNYVGPDRRFHDLGAPDGVGRRREDVENGAASPPSTLEIGDTPSAA